MTPKWLQDCRFGAFLVAKMGRKFENVVPEAIRKIDTEKMVKMIQKSMKNVQKMVSKTNREVSLF